MRGKPWIRTAVMTVAAIASAGELRAAESPGNPGAATAPDANPAVTSVSDLTQVNAVDLKDLQTTLDNPLSTLAQREEAARRLVNRQSPEAMQILRAALQNSGNPSGQAAVARALADDRNPDPAFIPSLNAAIASNARVAEAAALALAGYGDSADSLTALRNAATNEKLPELSRAAVIRSMGLLADKSIAETLENLLNNNSSVIQLAAADALTEMTGIRDNGQDIHRWQQWWKSAQGRSDSAWRSDLLALRARDRERYTQLADGLRIALSDAYSLVADPAKKNDALLGYLNSRLPEVRATGAYIVADDFVSGRRISDAVKQRLRLLVGDSDRDVRSQVAQTILSINDRDAVDSLINQLAQEKDPSIRITLAQALGRINEIRAVPALLEMLNGPDNDEASAAASAIADLGEKLRVQNPELSRAAVDAIQRVLDANANKSDPAATALRSACVAALAKIRDPRSTNTFLQLLKPREPTAVRRAALRGLGNLGDPQVDEAIAGQLNDGDPLVRLEAAQALLSTATFKQAEQLYGKLDPQEESDSRVRDAVWEVLKRVLHTGTTQELNDWPDRFKNDQARRDPLRRLEALYALQDAQAKDHNNLQLAYTRQNIADALMQATPPRADEAADDLQKALDYWRTEGKDQPGGETTLDGLVGQMLNVLCQAKRYPDAAKFAEAQIGLSRQYQQTVGPYLKQEADNLRVHHQNTDALQLIDAALNGIPSLDPKYRDDLKEIRKDVTTAAPPGGP